MDVQWERSGRALWVGAGSGGAARFLSVAVCTTQSVARTQPLPACLVLAGAVLGNGGEGAESSGCSEESRTRGSEWIPICSLKPYPYSPQQGLPLFPGVAKLLDNISVSS